MPADQHSFAIPDRQHIQDLVSLLKEKYPVRVLPEKVSHRVFYDTFDWRLYKNGSVLEMVEEGESRKIYWRADNSSMPKIQLGLKDIPGLASEFPEGELRKQLEPVVSVRELVPRISIQIKCMPVVVLNAKEKVVVRINFEVYRFRTSKLRASKVLGRRLSLKVVKGYPAEYRQVEAMFQDLKFFPAQDNMLKLALITKGISVNDYSTRLIFLLDPEMSTEEALKKILLRLLEILQQNTRGCITGKDIEFIRDYNQAVDKTVFALKFISEAFPHRVTQEFTDFFANLAQLTRKVRDFDDLLLQLAEYRREQKKMGKKSFGLLHEYLLRIRTDAHTALSDVLKSSAYREKMSLWQEYLKDTESGGDGNEKTTEPVYRLADKLIWTLYQQTIDDSRIYVLERNDRAMHEYFSLFGKLAYLLEFFRSLYPVTDMLMLIRELNAVQDNLSRLKDHDIQTGILEEFAVQSENAKAIQACNLILYKLEDKRRNAENPFSAAYELLASPYIRDKFSEMFVDYHRGL